MVLRKSKPHLSTADGTENEGNRVETVQRKSTGPVDHWAFLDEIEAPMWVDFTLELQSTYQDKDDKWFHMSHPFHQCSSQQLISTFSLSGVECTNSSPKLPASVSRSRGKHYRSKEWGEGNCRITSDKRHLVKKLNSKSSLVNHESANAKNKARCGNLKTRQAVLFPESSLSQRVEQNYSKPISRVGYTRAPSKSIAMQESKSNSTSTITCEGGEILQQKSSEVSSQLFGHPSGLLSALKISLRKSCVMRQASRVDRNGRRQSEGCKSSSSKSSVGSSSNPGYNDKNSTVNAGLKKEKTPDSRDVMNICEASKNKVKVSNVSKVPAIQVQDTTPNFKYRGKTDVLKATNHEDAQAKVQCHNMHAKILVSDKIDEQYPLTAAARAKGYEKANQYNRNVDGGKENTSRSMVAVGRKFCTRENPVAGMVHSQKVRKTSITQNINRTKSIGLKDKVNTRGEGKKSANVVQKVYFR